MNKAERIKQSRFPITRHNILRLREQKHLRNMDLAAKLQLEGIPISTSTLSRIEQGGPAVLPPNSRLPFREYRGVIAAASSAPADPGLVFYPVIPYRLKTIFFLCR